jgi:hypothetical protein
MLLILLLLFLFSLNTLRKFINYLFVFQMIMMTKRIISFDKNI